MSRPNSAIQTLRQNLIDWYLHNQRPLPWRSTRDPYHIWLSEVMLQQTTVKAVIPYYEKFLLHFPKVQDLAKASTEEVNALWAGLGYYSRARNLQAAAIRFADEGFPRTAAELIDFPGFGPYTANAVASFAFGEAVGVLDGNVIRLLSRQFGLAVEWWSPKGRKALQEISDQLALGDTPDIVNQALIEMGATVCTPKSPTCILCPWSSSCVALKENKVLELPLRRLKSEGEYWKWDVSLVSKSGLLPLVKNTSGPFLKNSWVFPGTFSKVETAPKKFAVKHGITRYDIYVDIDTKKKLKDLDPTAEYQWVEPNSISKINPSSLLRKVLVAASVALGVSFSGCKSKEKVQEVKAIPVASKIAGIEKTPANLGANSRGTEKSSAEEKDLVSSPTLTGSQITQFGTNSEPNWSPDGLKFTFVSEGRVQHKQKQIYEWSFPTGKESRVVFSDGNAKNPAYWGGDSNEIAFLSNTDSLKEQPAIVLKRPRIELFEMFVYVLNPLEIKKIGSPTEVFLKQINTKRKSLANGHTAWLTNNALHWSPTPSGKAAKTIEVDATDLDEISAGRIHQDEIILFSGVSKASEHRQIYAYWPEADILFRPFPNDQFNFTSPRISPTDERLLFVSDQTGPLQVFVTSIGGSR